MESIRLANASPYGLSAGVFYPGRLDGDPLRPGDRLGQRDDQLGSVWRSDLMPYGGWKASGVGKEGVRFAMDEMSEMKTVIFHGISI